MVYEFFFFKWFISLYNNQINAHALIGQSAMGYCAGKPRKNRASSELLYKSDRPRGMLIEHETICKPRAAGEWFTNSSNVLPTSQVVYQPITHRKLVVYCFYIIIQKTRDFSVVYRHNNPKLPDQSERAH